MEQETAGESYSLEPEHPAQAGPDAPLVLVVEDNADMSAFIAEVLAPHYRVACAFNGREGLERARVLLPDLILSDVMMPGMSGDQMVQALRREPALVDVPIVMLTARVDNDLRVRMLKEGVQDYLNKPFLVEELLARVGGLVASRRRILEELRCREEFANRVIDMAPGAMLVVNAQGHIIRVNAQTEQIFGYPLHELLGRPVEMLVPTQVRAHHKALRLGYGYKPTPWAMNQGREVFGLHQDGHEIPLEISLASLLLGEEQHVIAAITDVTERKQAEEEIRHLNADLERRIAERTAELERSNADLEQFAYVASHDLQEPLRMVSSYLQLIERRYRGRLDADADEFIGYAVDGAVRMKSMIIDLLDYSRVGTRNHPSEPIDCEALLGGVLKDLERAIKEGQAEVSHDTLPTVLADAAQLGRVFQNLVGNALKFRRLDMSPRIHIGAERVADQKADEPNVMWRFSVRDNGIGIAPEYHQRIFQIFERLHGKNAYPGSGIGLAICKKIVERRGGRLWVESAEDSGTTFFFTLPGV